LATLFTYIFTLTQAGEKLGKFEVQKRLAVDNEDYDEAKQKKVQMDEFRQRVYEHLEIGQLIENYKVNSNIYCIHYRIKFIDTNSVLNSKYSSVMMKK